jgi:hypothetical protein
MTRVVLPTIVLGLFASSASAESLPAGLGEVYSHQPSKTPVLAAAVEPAPGGATYGLQRTNISGKPLWRDSGCIDVVYDADTISNAMAKVISESFAAWSLATDQAACGSLAVSHSFARGIGAVADGITTIRVRTDSWPYDPAAAAVTRVVFVDSPFSEVDGKIVEADMELNAVDFAFVLPGEVAPSSSKPALYVRAVVTHEIGHLLGLGHDCGTGAEPWPADQAGQGVPACDAAGPSTQAATMYYAVGNLDDAPSTLEPADVAGACVIAHALTCEGDAVGGCNAVPRGSRGGTWLVLVGLVVLLARRGRRSREA